MLGPSAEDMSIGETTGRLRRTNNPGVGIRGAANQMHGKMGYNMNPYNQYGPPNAVYFPSPEEVMALQQSMYHQQQEQEQMWNNYYHQQMMMHQNNGFHMRV